MQETTLHDDPVIRDLEIMEPAKNYSGWIHGVLAPHMGKRIVECGAGIGNITELMLDRELVLTTDAHQPCIDYMRRRFKDHPNVVPMRATLGDPDFLEARHHSPDTVVCINVLEHVQDDLAALRDMCSVLPVGGRVVVLVPAHMFLYGSMDRRLGHYRRYNKKEIVGKLQQVGLKVERSFYMNAITTLGWFLNNRVMSFEDQSPTQVMVFDRWIVPWLKQVERVIKPPFGMSVIAIGRKLGVGQA
jgi:2-polyprenyl-3-methyl-5-hydroxy-6-metoxy-1,4-benzoquinol methylase